MTTLIHVSWSICAHVSVGVCLGMEFLHPKRSHVMLCLQIYNKMPIFQSISNCLFFLTMCFNILCLFIFIVYLLSLEYKLPRYCFPFFKIFYLQHL